MIEFLLAKGVDLSSAYRYDSCPGSIYDEMALITAAEKSHEPATRFMLKLGIRTDKIHPFSCWASDGPEVAENVRQSRGLYLSMGLDPCLLFRQGYCQQSHRLGRQ